MTDWLHSEVDGGNIDGWSLRQPVFAIQLSRIENIEGEKFDGSLAKRQIRQNFPLYGIQNSLLALFLRLSKTISLMSRGHSGPWMLPSLLMYI